MGRKLKAQSSKLKGSSNSQISKVHCSRGSGSWALGFLLSFELCALSFAAAPALDHFFPVAIQVGTTNSITAVGKFDPWPAKVWLDTAGILFKPETNSGKFSVEVTTNAPVGPHLIRLFNEQGASALRFLIVTHKAQLAEQEPNDDYTKPQMVEEFPASINGRLEKSGDVDSFAVQLEAGQTLIASVEAFTLASPVDMVMRLLDDRGVQVAWNHDERTLDPFLVWTAKSAATYVLQVFGFIYPAQSEVRFTGNDKCVYRLHLSRGPYVHHTLPLGVQRGTNTALRLVGWNLEKAQHHEIHFDAAGLSAEVSQTSFRPPGFDNTIMLPVGERAELMEQEPNDIASEANCLEVPGAVTGCIEKTGDQDRFRFAGKKSEKFLLEIQSAALGFPLDAQLGIEDQKGRELAKNDDGAGVDPKLEWTAPEDGPFVATIGNTLHRGGTNYLYRFSIRRAAPTITMNVSETAFTITPGQTKELKVAVKCLHGFQSKLALSVRDLPQGLAVEPVDVPENGGDIKLKIVASAEAKAFSGPIRIAATEEKSRKEYWAVADLTSSTVDNGVPGGFNKLVIESTDQFWLTVLPAPVATDSKK